MPAAYPVDDTFRLFLQGVFACSEEVAEAIRQRAGQKGHPAGATILSQGGGAGETFLLVLGRAHALLYATDGQLVLLQEFLPGDLFGVVLPREPAADEAEVVAAEDSRTAVFTAYDFVALIERHSCVGLAVSRMLLKQLRDARERMVERTTLSAVGRVHAELLRLARAGDGRRIRPAPVFAALALRVQSTRETVSRAVNALERRGIVRREGDELVILAPHRLQELVV